MNRSYTCICGHKTVFVFGNVGSRALNWGCDDCPHNYRMAQLSEARRRRTSAEGRLRKRKCGNCAQEYRPIVGRRNTKNCPDCVIIIQSHKYRVRHCSMADCEIEMGPSKQMCPKHKTESVRRIKAKQVVDKKRRRAAVAKKQLTRCIICPTLYDWRLTVSRHKNGQVDVCPTCYADPKIRADLGVPTPNPQRHKPS
jgi:hypothetical protein